MNRYLMPLMLVVSIVFLWSGTGAVLAGSEHPECRQACSDCQTVCEKTLAYCQKQGGKHADSEHIKLLKDCIATCKASADLMKRGSQFQHKMCTLCAEVCQKCAESCESFDDKVMKDCAAECRKCAEHCTRMES